MMRQWIIIIHPLHLRMIGFPCVRCSSRKYKWLILCAKKKCNSVCNFVPLCVFFNAAHTSLFITFFTRLSMYVCVNPTPAYDYLLWWSQNSNKRAKQSESYINGVHNPINLFASVGNPLQILLLFFSPPPPCIYFLLFLTAGGFVCGRVEKQVNVCSACALSDPIDLIQQGGNVEIWTLLAITYCSILKAHSALQTQPIGTIGKQAGQWKQLVNKTKPKKKNLIPHGKSQNKPDRKRGIGCAGWVTADRVRATDEWIQEAVTSDIFHQTSQSDKKCHSRD